MAKALASSALVGPVVSLGALQLCCSGPPPWWLHILEPLQNVCLTQTGPDLGSHLLLHKNHPFNTLHLFLCESFYQALTGPEPVCFGRHRPGRGGAGKNIITLPPIHPSLFIPPEIDLAESIGNELISRELIGMFVKRQEQRGEQIHGWMAGGFKQPERSSA